MDLTKKSEAKLHSKISKSNYMSSTDRDQLSGMTGHSEISNSETKDMSSTDRDQLSDMTGHSENPKTETKDMSSTDRDQLSGDTEHSKILETKSTEDMSTLEEVKSILAKSGARGVVMDEDSESGSSLLDTKEEQDAVRSHLEANRETATTISLLSDSLDFGVTDPDMDSDKLQEDRTEHTNKGMAFVANLVRIAPKVEEVRFQLCHNDASLPEALRSTTALRALQVKPLMFRGRDSEMVPVIRSLAERKDVSTLRELSVESFVGVDQLYARSTEALIDLLGHTPDLETLRVAIGDNYDKEEEAYTLDTESKEEQESKDDSLDTVTEKHMVDLVRALPPKLHNLRLLGLQRAATHALLNRLANEFPSNSLKVLELGGICGKESLALVSNVVRAHSASLRTLALAGMADDLAQLNSALSSCQHMQSSNLSKMLISGKKRKSRYDFDESEEKESKRSRNE